MIFGLDFSPPWGLQNHLIDFFAPSEVFTVEFWLKIPQKNVEHPKIITSHRIHLSPVTLILWFLRFFPQPKRSQDVTLGDSLTFQAVHLGWTQASLERTISELKAFFLMENHWGGVGKPHLDAKNPWNKIHDFYRDSFGCTNTDIERSHVLFFSWKECWNNLRMNKKRWGHFSTKKNASHRVFPLNKRIIWRLWRERW